MSEQKTKAVQLVCRDDFGNELSRQWCENEAQAERLMIARNRPPPGTQSAYPRWAIETQTEIKPQPTAPRRHYFPRLKVLPCPIHKGKHPLHDARYIVTADLEPEVSENDDGEKTWRAAGLQGAIIATMTDCQNQAQYARLFAQAPLLLDYLRSATAWIRKAGGDVATLDDFLSQFNREAK